MELSGWNYLLVESSEKEEGIELSFLVLATIVREQTKPNYQTRQIFV